MSLTGPDWAALYSKHRQSMYRVAAQVLREAGLEDQAGDAVQDAMISLMKSPPTDVVSWEAILVVAAKRKAVDFLRSASVRHAGPNLGEHHDQADERNDIEEAGDALDRQKKSARAWDALSILDPRHRTVAEEYVAKERPRAEVASELGVTPARVSQMAAKAIEQLRLELMRQEAK